MPSYSVLPPGFAYLDAKLILNCTLELIVVHNLNIWISALPSNGYLIMFVFPCHSRSLTIKRTLHFWLSVDFSGEGLGYLHATAHDYLKWSRY